MKTPKTIFLLLVILISGHSFAQTFNLIKSGNQNSYFSPNSFYEFNNHLFFIDYDASSEWQIWKSDDTKDGTQICTDFTTIGGRNPYGFATLNNKMLFALLDDINFQSFLWITDGTSKGTFKFTDINSQTPFDVYSPYTINDKMYFAANDNLHGNELWITNGSIQSTHMVKDIQEGRNDSAPVGFIDFNNKIYFIATDSIHGTEIWLTDGTESGTKISD